MKSLTLYKKQTRHSVPVLKKEELDQFFNWFKELNGELTRIDQRAIEFKGRHGVKSSFSGDFELRYEPEIGNMQATFTALHKGKVKPLVLYILPVAIITQVLFMYSTDGFSDLPFIPPAFAVFEVIMFTLVFFLNARIAVSKNEDAIKRAISHWVYQRKASKPMDQ